MGRSGREGNAFPTDDHNEEWSYLIHSLNAFTAPLRDIGPEEGIISGECLTWDATLVEQGGMAFRVWKCTPGSWRTVWKTWETFTILEGAGTLTEETTGTVHKLEPGVMVTLPEGAIGVWEVTQPILKTYVMPV